MSHKVGGKTYTITSKCKSSITAADPARVHYTKGAYQTSTWLEWTFYDTLSTGEIPAAGQPMSFSNTTYSYDFRDMAWMSAPSRCRLLAIGYNVYTSNPAANWEGLRIGVAKSTVLNRHTDMAAGTSEFYKNEFVSLGYVDLVGPGSGVNLAANVWKGHAQFTDPNGVADSGESIGFVVSCPAGGSSGTFWMTVSAVFVAI